MDAAEREAGGEDVQHAGTGTRRTAIERAIRKGRHLCARDSGGGAQERGSEMQYARMLWVNEKCEQRAWLGPAGRLDSCLTRLRDNGLITEHTSSIGADNALLAVRLRRGALPADQAAADGDADAPMLKLWAGVPSAARVVAPRSVNGGRRPADPATTVAGDSFARCFALGLDAAAVAVDDDDDDDDAVAAPPAL